MYKVLFSICFFLIALQTQCVQSAEKVGLKKLLEISRDDLLINMAIYEMKICNEYGRCRNLLQTREGKEVYFYSGSFSMDDKSYINMELFNQSHLESGIFSSVTNFYQKGIYVFKETFSSGFDGAIEGCKTLSLVLGIGGGLLTLNPLASAALGYFEGSLLWGTVQGGATMAALGGFLPGIFGAVQGVVAGCLLGAAGGALIVGSNEFMVALDNENFPDSERISLSPLNALINRLTPITREIQISLDFLVKKLSLEYAVSQF